MIATSVPLWPNVIVGYAIMLAGATFLFIRARQGFRWERRYRGLEIDHDKLIRRINDLDEDRIEVIVSCLVANDRLTIRSQQEYLRIRKIIKEALDT